jgi:glycosyltransferase involved in cell wall biosynthesis
MPAAAYIFSLLPGDQYLVGRTRRSLQAAGVSEVHFAGDFSRLPWGQMSGKPALILRAGVWLAGRGPLALPADSGTGLGLCAVGLPRRPDPSGGQPEPWRQWHHQCSGNFSASARPEPGWPAPLALYLNPRASQGWSDGCFGSTDDFWRRALAELRVVHYGPLDVYSRPELRVMQVITALQRGGAERLTLNLMEDLPKTGVQVQLATLGTAQRAAFPAPPGTLALAAIPDGGARLPWLRRHAAASGVDLLHAHLLTGQELQMLASGGIPLVTTVHNTQPGWQEGMDLLRPGDSSLLVACAQAVEQELADIYRSEPQPNPANQRAGVSLPIRTVWNGIRRAEFQPAAGATAAAREWRQQWGFAADDLVLLSLANPRPQKRLDRLPSILAAVKARLPEQGVTRPVRLVLAGEVTPGKFEAEECVAKVKAELARLGLETEVRWTGPVEQVADLLAAVDVLICCSAHEGLSLAQLEALSMGKWVVATEVGGGSEVARKIPALRLVPKEATTEQFTQALLSILAQPKPVPQLPPELGRDFDSEQMARRYRWLYRRAIARHDPDCRPRGLWLITNNFSTGGAQSSARRLLGGLHEQGIRVRAAVVQEDPAAATPGCRALAAAGIPVLALPAAATRLEAAVEPLLEALDADPPQAVLFWNLMPPYKILLADALLDTPVYDVSPGEMYFDSLTRYFAQPMPGLPYLTPRDYGQRLAGVIVKYQAEATRAAAVLGAPVQVIPNGVALPPARRETADRRGPLIIGTAARIHPQKRLEDLLEALRLAHDQLPPYQLLVAGEAETDGGDYALRLRALSQGLPVEWLGEVADMGSFHSQLDLFVMIANPAGCPNASLEALAAGLPVIATDVGGASEQVVDGQVGRLVPTQQPAALAQAIIELANHPDLRAQMGKAARAHVQDRFSLPRMLAAYRQACLT